MKGAAKKYLHPNMSTQNPLLVLGHVQLLENEVLFLQIK